MRYYFAHSVSDFGTPYEAELIERFEHVFGARSQIENPNQQHHQFGYAECGMDYFRDVTDSCDGCVFLRLPDGCVGAGVAMEIGWFRESGRPVFEIGIDRHGTLFMLPMTEAPYPTLDRLETRAETARLRALDNGGRA